MVAEIPGVVVSDAFIDTGGGQCPLGGLSP
jgi:hypothetical protein